MGGYKVVLISGVIIMFLYYAFRLRSAPCGYAGARLFFTEPSSLSYSDYTNKILGQLGVGRGTKDLLFYVVYFFLFIIGSYLPYPAAWKEP
jgi:hypothetical protein